jgi:hypothetical protein
MVKERLIFLDRVMSTVLLFFTMLGDFGRLSGFNIRKRDTCLGFEATVFVSL